MSSSIHADNIALLDEKIKRFLAYGYVEEPAYHWRDPYYKTPYLMDAKQELAYFKRLAKALKRPYVIIRETLIHDYIRTKWELIGKAKTVEIKNLKRNAPLTAPLNVIATQSGTGHRTWSLAGYLKENIPLYVYPGPTILTYHFFGDVGHAILDNWLLMIRTDPKCRKALGLDNAI